MVKTTFKQLEKRFNFVYMASAFYLSIWTCWNTELQRVQVNQCQFCVLKPKKLALPSFLVVCSCSLFSTCLDYFMILALTHRECVIVFILKMLLPHFTVFYFIFCLDILKCNAFLIKHTVCSIFMIDETIDKEINC